MGIQTGYLRENSVCFVTLSPLILKTGESLKTQEV